MFTSVFGLAITRWQRFCDNSSRKCAGLNEHHTNNDKQITGRSRSNYSWKKQVKNASSNWTMRIWDVTSNHLTRCQSCHLDINFSVSLLWKWSSVYLVDPLLEVEITKQRFLLQFSRLPVFGSQNKHCELGDLSNVPLIRYPNLDVEY